MQEQKDMQQVELPENAFRELREGEEYTPLMKPQKTYPEITWWSVGWGVLMAILFSAATAYLGLKFLKPPSPSPSLPSDSAAQLTAKMRWAKTSSFRASVPAPA